MSCTTFDEPEGLRDSKQVAVEIIVADTGCGISPLKLQSFFREFEKVESSDPRISGDSGVGMCNSGSAKILELTCLQVLVLLW